MKKSPFSKLKSETTESRQQTDTLYRTESYRRKARKMLMRLRSQNRQGVEQEHKQEEAQKPPVHLEAMSYQARYGALMTTRLEALEGMVMVSRFDELTWTTIERALDDEEPEVRAKAAELLATYPPSMPEVVFEKLIERAWDPELMVRRIVAHTLSFHPDPRSIGPLMGLLGSRDDELREIVEDSLSTICTKLGPPPPRIDADA